MFAYVNTKDPYAVEQEVRSIYQSLYPESDPSLVSKSFEWITDCFSGNYGNYQGIDIRYHDLEHTFQVLVCLMRLIRGRHFADIHPKITTELCELSMVAMLLHDTGYLKRSDDLEGTGAKYTLTHVARSCDFAAELLGEKGYSEEDITSIQNMISCTGVDVKLDSIPFSSELERIAGFALGTSDLLGQMAADNYIDKLPHLYIEFEESYQHTKKTTNVARLFSDVNDLMRSTSSFWANYVEPKINNDFSRLYEYLNDPYPQGPNQYIERIEANVARIEKMFKINTQTNGLRLRYPILFPVRLHCVLNSHLILAYSLYQPEGGLREKGYNT